MAWDTVAEDWAGLSRPPAEGRGQSATCRVFLCLPAEHVLCMEPVGTALVGPCSAGLILRLRPDAQTSCCSTVPGTLSAPPGCAAYIGLGVGPT